MAGANVAANWVVGKRMLHWGMALAVLAALLAPKPGDGDGLLHIMAGSLAAALALTRLSWRLAGDVRPYVRDAMRLRRPAISKGARGVAPTLMQLGRLMGFAFLVALPVTAAVAIVGLSQGEALLEVHEVLGTAIMIGAVAHAVVVIAFALLIKYDLVTIAISGPARAVFEGGARGVLGAALGLGVAAAALTYVWGPYDVQTRAASFSDEGGEGEHESDDD